MAAAVPVVELSPADKARIVSIATDFMDGLADVARRFKRRQAEMWTNPPKPRRGGTMHADVSAAQIDAADARKWESEMKGALHAAQTMRELVALNPEIKALVVDDDTILGGSAAADLDLLEAAGVIEAAP